jgi:hypothetical protein
METGIITLSPVLDGGALAASLRTAGTCGFDAARRSKPRAAVDPLEPRLRGR